MEPGGFFGSYGPIFFTSNRAGRGVCFPLGGLTVLRLPRPLLVLLAIVVHLLPVLGWPGAVHRLTAPGPGRRAGAS